MKKQTPSAKTLPTLPKGIKPADLQSNYKNWKRDQLTAAQVAVLEEAGLDRYYYDRFEIWYIPADQQWVMPTLDISRARSQFARRTYAVGATDQKNYRVGAGPHVGAQRVVYLRRSNFNRLLPFLKLLHEGRKHAHTTRDRISSRRARTIAGFEW